MPYEDGEAFRRVGFRILEGEPVHRLPSDARERRERRHEIGRPRARGDDRASGDEVAPTRTPPPPPPSSSSLGEEHSRRRLVAPDLVAFESGSDLGPPTPHPVCVEDLVGYPPFPGHVDRALDEGRRRRRRRRMLSAASSRSRRRGSSDDESTRAQEQAPPLLATVVVVVSDHPDLPLQLLPQFVRSCREGGVLGTLPDGEAGYPRVAVTRAHGVGGEVAVDAEGGYAHAGEGEEGRGSHGAEAHDDDVGVGGPPRCRRHHSVGEGGGR